MDDSAKNLPAREKFPLKQWIISCAAVVAACLLAHLIRCLPLPHPICGFRALTGCPCPFCGGLRCLENLFFLNFAQALILNPLVFLVCMVALTMSLVKIAAHFFPISPNRPPQTASRFPWSKIILSLILANWLYLIWALSKGWV